MDHTTSVSNVKSKSTYMPDGRLNPEADSANARLFTYYLPKTEPAKANDAITYAELKWSVDPKATTNEECAYFNNASVNTPNKELRREMIICRKPNSSCHAGNTNNCYTRIDPVPVAYDSKDNNQCGMVDRGCKGDEDDFADGNNFKAMMKKELHEASAKEVCQFLHAKEKSIMGQYTDYLGSFSPAKWFSAGNDQKTQQLTKIGVKADTIMQTDSAQSCRNDLNIKQSISFDNTCTAELAKVYAKYRQQCIDSTKNIKECADAFKVPETRREGVTEFNQGLFLADCQANKTITSKHKTDAKLSNTLLQQINQKASNLMSNNKSETQNCNVISQDMSACQYLQERQCCTNKANVDQSINVNCGFALTEINVNKKNMFAAQQKCSLESTTTMDSKQLSELINFMQSKVDQKADSMAVVSDLIWGLIAPFLIIIAIVILPFLLIFGGSAAMAKKAATSAANAGSSALMYLRWWVPFIACIIALLFMYSNNNKSIEEHTSTQAIPLRKNQTFFGKRQPASEDVTQCVINQITLTTLQNMLYSGENDFSAFDFFVPEGVKEEDFSKTTTKGTAFLYKGDVTIDDLNIDFHGIRNPYRIDGQDPKATLEARQGNESSAFFNKSSLTYSESLETSSEEPIRKEIKSQYGTAWIVIGGISIFSFLFAIGGTLRELRKSRNDEYEYTPVPDVIHAPPQTAPVTAIPVPTAMPVQTAIPVQTPARPVSSLSTGY